MTTVNGIELDLNESKYKSDYEEYSFYFSSLNYKNKFEEKLMPYIILETAKIKNKYGVGISLNIYLAVALYKKIEKRGFRIVNNYMGYELNETSSFNCEQWG